MLISGSGALKGNLRALNQSISSQVLMLMKDPFKLARRSGVPQQQRPRVLCHMDPKPSAVEATEEADDKAEVAGAAEGDEEVDFDMFDDDEFYAQLLKEFLEGSGPGKQSMNGVYPQVSIWITDLYIESSGDAQNAQHPTCDPDYPQVSIWITRSWSGLCELFPPQSFCVELP